MYGEQHRRRIGPRSSFTAYSYIPTAQFIIPTAFRSNLSGVIVSPVTFLWNVEKK